MKLTTITTDPIIRRGEGYTFSLSPETIQVKNDLIASALEVTEISTVEQATAARSLQLKALADYRIRITKESFLAVPRKE